MIAFLHDNCTNSNVQLNATLFDTNIKGSRFDRLSIQNITVHRHKTGFSYILPIDCTIIANNYKPPTIHYVNENGWIIPLVWFAMMLFTVAITIAWNSKYFDRILDFLYQTDSVLHQKKKRKRSITVRYNNTNFFEQKTYTKSSWGNHFISLCIAIKSLVHTIVVKKVNSFSK